MRTIRKPVRKAYISVTMRELGAGAACTFTALGRFSDGDFRSILKMSEYRRFPKPPSRDPKNVNLPVIRAFVVRRIEPNKIPASNNGTMIGISAI